MFLNKVLEEKKSKYNGLLKVVKTLGMGTYIQSDGLTQSGGIVETIWKQTLKKLNKKEINVKNILILGLGGGTVAGLLRKKYPNVKITGVEIDPIMIDFGKKYLKLDSYGIDIEIKDANKLEIGKYDLVIVDLYNSDKYPEVFEEINFLESLKKSKLIIFNRLYYKNKKKEAFSFEKKLKKVFTRVDTFYPVSNVMFFCS